MPLTRRRQFRQWIALERRGIVNVVPVHLGVKHRKAIMMLGRDDHIFHPRRLRGLDPLVRVEFHGIKLAREFRVFRDRDLGVVHDPFTDRGNPPALVRPRWHRINAPMNEHPEPGLAPPLHSRVPLFGRFVSSKRRLGRWRGLCPSTHGGGRSRQKQPDKKMPSVHGLEYIRNQTPLDIRHENL